MDLEKNLIKKKDDLESAITNARNVLDSLVGLHTEVIYELEALRENDN